MLTVIYFTLFHLFSRLLWQMITFLCVQIRLQWNVAIPHLANSLAPVWQFQSHISL